MFKTTEGKTEAGYENKRDDEDGMGGNFCSGLVDARRSGGPARNKPREIQGEFQDDLEKLRALRDPVHEFYQAMDAGNGVIAQAAAKKAKAAWFALPKELRTKVEEKHPGTSDRVTSLNLEFEAMVLAHHVGLTEKKTVTHEGSATHANGKIVEEKTTWVKDGNTLTKEGKITGPNGNTATTGATLTKEEKTVIREGSTTGPNGKTATSDTTWTKEGNTITKEGTLTGPNGQTGTTEATVTKQGNTITREGSATGSNGKSITSEETWTRNGNTVSPEGKIVTSGENVVVQNEAGETEGNALSHKNGVNRDRSSAVQWTPSYKDNYDLFGGRTKPPVKSTAPAAHHGSGRR